MKKIALLLLITLTFSGSAFANEYFNDFKDDLPKGDMVAEVKTTQQRLFDYTGGATGDGLPTYVGYAKRGASTAGDSWLIYKYTYDGSDQVTAITSARDAWDDRGSATYA